MAKLKDFSEFSSVLPSEYDLLKKEGLKMLSIIKDELEDDLADWEENHPIAVMMALALQWADYSTNKTFAFDYLVHFINADVAVNNDKFEKAKGRYGVEALKSTAQSYRKFLNWIKQDDFRHESASAKTLISKQNKWLSWVTIQKAQGAVSGFGAWFFAILFYQIVLLRQELWEDSSLESLCMPTGLEVNKGLRKAKKAGLPAFQNMDETKLIPYDADITDSFSQLMVVQSYLNEVAKKTSSSVIVINAGLYSLGKGKYKLR